MIIQQLEQSIQKLEHYLNGTQWIGYDPYDALNSPILAKLSMHSTYLKIAFTQGLKLSPFNLRPFLGVKKGYNPKGIGLFLCSYLKLYRLTKDRDYLEKIHFILRILERTRSTGYDGYCWGYNFDWQSRTGFSAKFTPTLVNTAFIAHAYLDAYEVLGDARLLSVARSSGYFILNNLNRHYQRGSVCFSYTPFDHTHVVNATMLGSGLLARLFKFTQYDCFAAFAKKSADYVIEQQHADGSWYYADTDYQKWIDSHHTGFVVEGLYNYIHFSEDAVYLDNLKMGLDFYKRHFFLPNGYPMFFADTLFPVDVHCPAQAIVTFSRLVSIENNDSLLEKIANWFIENMQNGKGYFYYRIEKYFKNKIPYIRWGQAWAFHALTTYLLKLKKM